MRQGLCAATCRPPGLAGHAGSRRVVNIPLPYETHQGRRGAERPTDGRPRIHTPEELRPARRLMLTAEAKTNTPAGPNVRLANIPHLPHLIRCGSSPLAHRPVSGGMSRRAPQPHAEVQDGAVHPSISAAAEALINQSAVRGDEASSRP
ncbi:hypothetical protein AAFF_G00313320 [Aldrovandia affinis]|uniref:Uncharacterized protein n=1 Tax=Aldrovandia affinis TaxID=143900 RepID=A0AAD7SNU7_9TELE|nr:hypothetical protein AAFF_G00313320 [Aldrovandia affinis]